MRKVEALSNYLKMHRKRSGLTQREVAYLLGCGHGSKVSRYERGARLPGLLTLLAYEIIFGVRAYELFRGTHDRVREQVHVRTKRLMRELDAEPFTPLTKCKVDNLTEVVYSSVAPGSRKAA